MAKELPIVELEGYGAIKFYRDCSLEQYRAVECPHLFIDFDAAPEESTRLFEYDGQELVEAALFRFWQEIAAAHPEAQSGDLSPMMAVRLQEAAKHAVEEWKSLNLPASNLK